MCEGLSWGTGVPGYIQQHVYPSVLSTVVPLFKDKNEEYQTQGLHSDNCYDASFEEFSTIDLFSIICYYVPGAV